MSLWTWWMTGRKEGGTVPPAPYVPDWQPLHSEWTTRYSCHCGHVYDGIPFTWTACPTCGCQDSFKGEVGRTEWEVDLNFWHAEPGRIAERGMMAQFFPDLNKRNIRWVPKPEGCQKVDVP